jgi:hypothetical protein
MSFCVAVLLRGTLSPALAAAAGKHRASLQLLVGRNLVHDCSTLQAVRRVYIVLL